MYQYKLRTEGAALLVGRAALIKIMGVNGDKLANILETLGVKPVVSSSDKVGEKNLWSLPEIIHKLTFRGNGPALGKAQAQQEAFDALSPAEQAEYLVDKGRTRAPRTSDPVLRNILAKA